eukprot:6233287-Lingulodinium_polyedra.AAC.1
MPGVGRPMIAATTARLTAGKAVGVVAKANPGTPTSQPANPPGLAMPVAGKAAAPFLRPEPGEWRAGEGESSSDEGTRVAL